MKPGPFTFSTALVMAGILVLTSSPVPPREPPFPMFDKLVHLCLYGALALSAYRMLGELGVRRALWLWTLIFAAAFGAFDEVHQYLIPGREPSWGDWLVDAAGSAIAVAVSELVLPRSPRKRRV